MNTLIIDNYDSFTYNIAHIVEKVSRCEPTVIKNNTPLSALSDIKFDNIIISPGSGHPTNPEDVGLSKEVLRLDYPILGICLGCQVIGCFYGMEIIQSEIIHGQKSSIQHIQHPLFDGIPKIFHGVRYHSWHLRVPLDQNKDFIEIAKTVNKGVIMAIAHQKKPIFGLQFHPESILTQYGERIIQNFQNISKKSILPPSQPMTINTKIIPYINPELIFEKLFRNKNFNFWLDSEMFSGEQAKFSYMGDTTGPYSHVIQYYLAQNTIKIIHSHKKQTIHHNDIFNYLKLKLRQYNIDKNIDLPFDFQGGFIGYLDYEIKNLIFNATKLSHHPSHIPNAQWIFVDRMLVFDHHKQQIYILQCIPCADQESSLNQKNWLSDIANKINALKTMSCDKIKTQNDQLKIRSMQLLNKSAYVKKIDQCIQKLKQGESYEICLTEILSYVSNMDPWTYYKRVRKINPSPFASFFTFDHLNIVSCSPERFLKIFKNRMIQSKPIKGTIKKGTDTEETKKYFNQLKNDKKSQSENLMIVDLIRNDLSKISHAGTVVVKKLMDIETYATLHHMVSTIEGKLKDNIDSIDCIKATFPGGSMTGAPKKKTIEILDQIENSPRGIYSGVIGYLSINGTMDLSIVIRTVIFDSRKVYIGTGGAILINSNQEAEYNEALLKINNILSIMEQ